MTQALEPRDKQELESEGTRPGPVFRPDVDILERPDGFVIYADLPGVDESAIDARLEKGTLTLDAHFGSERDESWTPRHEEYRVGSYHREFRISDDIDSENVTAKVRNGVLELHLPKSAQTKPRTIAIQTG